ncbi:hypothetical protein PHYSODRAFT_318554 [Phytophthora sojae]|uniref:Transmembrane protein n=1 Tax=Phytophthora sojae (strain P6497) TaxID=1094619 RepID=G5A3Y7_PHYSP|nr:hypothetical protein PHYSODRAFT_318554 [Phytophthora sojae]EGZ10247.1 hypothetical protein PHYSODRAFT_318554 [Phytophthora sojae]|eukprot:XP_009535108.1 hypothetical protein PHYSODRAFT_318554 [Phytophthora sojae]
MSGHTDEKGSSAHWAEAYYQDQRKTQGWSSLCRPAAVAAYIAIAGRVIAGPLALILLFTSTAYLSDGTVFINADQSIFAFTERDPSMAGGCTGCLGPCKIAMLKYKLIENMAITSAPPFFIFTSLPPTESLYDFSSLSDEALTLCQSSKNEWGTSPIVVTGTAQELLNIITVAKLNLSPQMIRELELAIEHAEDCVTGWTMMSVVRLFQYPTEPDSTDFGQVPAVDTHVFPDYTECRPVVEITDELVGSKLAFDTDGRDLLAVVPDQLKLFPYSFTTTTVVQSYFRAYYGSCWVRAVNTTGVYIEDTCEVSKHWLSYGSMVHSPNDIPLCSTGGEHYIDPNVGNRVGMKLNTFRSRYADRVSISVLSGLVVAQLLALGIVSLYQVMSHKRSILLTEIWAYRCQNGVMQVIYLAQVTYHLVYNSDLCLLGLATGTLTDESIANLTCSFFAFSYSFINLAKARSGDRQLDRRFRLTWKAMQVAITLCVGLLLKSIQRTAIGSILSQNAEILCKTSARGAKYCGLNDACVLFRINMPTVVTVLSLALALVAAIISYTDRKVALGPSLLDNVTSFERNCLDAPFDKLFRDYDDIAYVVYNGKRCITVEALLLTGYLYYGEHIYRSSSVMLLLLARVVPKKIIRTFNVLLLLWRLDPKDGTLTRAHPCT